MSKKPITHIEEWTHPIYKTKVFFYYGYSLEEAHKEFPETAKVDCGGYCVSDFDGGIYLWVRFYDNNNYSTAAVLHELWHCFYKIKEANNLEITDENTAFELGYLYEMWEYGYDSWEFKKENN